MVSSSGQPIRRSYAQYEELCPDMPILVPGIGAQQGALEQSVAFGVDDSGANAVFNVSRGVLYASSDPGEYDRAARREALAMRDRINGQLTNRK